MHEGSNLHKFFIYSKTVNSGRKWDMELKPNHKGVSGHHTILHSKALNLHKTVKKVTL